MEDIQEQVCISKLFQLLLDPFDTVAGMEHVKFFAAFLCWLCQDDSIVTNVLFEASPNVWLTLKLDGTVDTHILDDLEGLATASWSRATILRS